MSKKKTHWVIPEEIWEKSSKKFQSGETDRCTNAAVGAFIGSSLELSCSIVGQVSNAGIIECPAHPSVRQKIRPKHRYGEFAALKEEVQDSNFEVEGSHTIYELTTIEEIKAVDEAVDRWVNSGFGNQLKYSKANGQQVSFGYIEKQRDLHREENKNIQLQKDEYIQSQGLQPTVVNGVKVSPEYPQSILDHLKGMNTNMWTATGVNLLIRISGKHTIAKDGNFVQGSLNQQQLNELAAKLNYKETDGFFKGTIRSRVISVPVQSVEHITSVLHAVSQGLNLNEFPKKVKDSKIVLVRTLKG